EPQGLLAEGGEQPRAQARVRAEADGGRVKGEAADDYERGHGPGAAGGDGAHAEKSPRYHASAGSPAKTTRMPARPRKVPRGSGCCVDRPRRAMRATPTSVPAM